MRNLRDAVLSSKTHFRFLLLVAVLCTLAGLTPLSTATAPPLTISVVNNSGWEIRHLYLSPANNDNWGPDQLTGYINPGVTRQDYMKRRLKVKSPPSRQASTKNH